MRPKDHTLCEHCREREATVHMAVVSWPSGEQMQHLCESCYPEIEAARTQSYNTQPAPTLPDNVEDITAAEYLDACARAAANGPDKIVIRHIGDELKRFPAARTRLAIELLTMGEHSLAQNDDACYLIGMGASFGVSIEQSRLQEFIGLLESIIHQSVVLMSEFSLPPSPHPYGFGLNLAISALHRASPSSLAKIHEKLLAQSDKRTEPNFRNVVEYFDNQISKIGIKKGHGKGKP
jgi:hypothetical protein